MKGTGDDGRKKEVVVRAGRERQVRACPIAQTASRLLGGMVVVQPDLTVEAVAAIAGQTVGASGLLEMLEVVLIVEAQLVRRVERAFGQPVEDRLHSVWVDRDQIEPVVP
jgi:hypothetical protein